MTTGKLPVEAGQLYRDLAPDMKRRDRRLRVTEVGDSHAALIVEHDLGGQAGKKTRASLTRLQSTAFELMEDASETDPLYLTLLHALSEVHGPDTDPQDYARAALLAVRSISQSDSAAI